MIAVDGSATFCAFTYNLDPQIVSHETLTRVISLSHVDSRPLETRLFTKPRERSIHIRVKIVGDGRLEDVHWEPSGSYGMHTSSK